ncbi:hypothetical protein [Pseudomonas sp. St316]|uniref:hypothetical protein n=1 Tax=Pseudomonas sp. St316 TaxID=2678257 RepID=UPI002016CF38|nr:hypothetical protein [Pseudomonas sp. St316]
MGFNGERREAKTSWYLLGNGYRAFNPVLMIFTVQTVGVRFGGRVKCIRVL